MVVGGAGTGCFPHRVEVTPNGTPRYTQCAIQYRMASPLQTIRPHIESADSSVRPADYQKHGKARVADWTTATLSFIYPHPDGAPDLVRLELRLCHIKPPQTTVPPSLPERIRSSLGATPFDTVAAGKFHDPRAPVTAVETRVLDLPRHELDLLIFELARTGFFEDQHRPHGQAEIEVHIDGGETSKRWTTEPRLDDLAARVYRDGQIQEAAGIPTSAAL